MDLLGELTPSDIEIHYNKISINELLHNKGNGHYLIHQGEQNDLRNPYTIYVNRISGVSGKINIHYGHVMYNHDENSFVGGGKSFDSLQNLLDFFNETLRYQIGGNFSQKYVVFYDMYLFIIE